MRIITKGGSQLVNEDELRAKLELSEREKRPLRIKLGLDPITPDIHLGHAVVMRKIKQMQDLGHESVIVIEDFTGKTGDPSGKSKGRVALTDEQVKNNGKRDFKKRYTENVPIGVHEFFYPLMQAYDSICLDADIELGGTDQTFNILMGRILQKHFDKQPQVAIFMPLLEGLDGIEKMSKSLGNYIGVYEPAEVMFKKVMEVPDSLILKYFELATDLHPDEIELIRKDLENGKTLEISNINSHKRLQGFTTLKMR